MPKPVGWAIRSRLAMFGKALFLGVFGIVGFVLVARSTIPGHVYAIDIATAEARLGDVEFRSILKGIHAERSVTDEGAARAVRWTFDEPRRKAAYSCTARLTPRSPHETHATLDCALGGDAADLQMAKKYIELVTLIMGEHVAAALDARDFDYAQAGRLTAGFFAINAPFVMASARTKPTKSVDN